jgi:pyruvate kinase
MSALPAPGPPPLHSVVSLLARLEQVRTALADAEAGADLDQYGPNRPCALNLLHYLAFRRFDLRREQSRLAHVGLSSLGRSESHVLYNLESVLGWLHLLDGEGAKDLSSPPGPTPEEGRACLQRNAQALFGRPRRGRGARIMVTLPSEAAGDARLLHGLLANGMDCARINCAHDGPAVWTRMIANLRRAEKAVGRRCVIEMDLAGPKIRTGAVRPGPQVLKLRPARDRLGRVTSPAEVWLTPDTDAGVVPAGAKRLLVPGAWLRRRRQNERIRFVDARGSRRALVLRSRAGVARRATLERTAYLTTATQLHGTHPEGAKDACRIGPIPAKEGRISLRVGDKIALTARPTPGEGAVRDARGRLRALAHIACTLPEALRFVRPGEPIWFDDGHIGGVVHSVRPAGLVVRVTHTPPAGGRLGADKGINLPASRLELPPIPPSDLEHLRFIVRKADLVGYSFVHTPSDLDRLRAELARLRRPRMGIVVKVETRRGFAELPGILLAGLRTPPVGVMIARGDLAVEAGYERLAEVQEEILWLCEAAHLPAIWATQVLEGLMKSGTPSRAEVTDAAMGERSECVMLNKGPHLVEGVQVLDNILRRMQSHQTKKTAMLRHLSVVDPYYSPPRKARRGVGRVEGRASRPRSPPARIAARPVA